MVDLFDRSFACPTSSRRGNEARPFRLRPHPPSAHVESGLVSRIVVAQDGLRARDNGPWGLTKLSFLDEYCPSAIQATAKKRQRYYIDLFAGPGRNVVRGRSGEEFDGSPLRVLRYTGAGTHNIAFTHAVFVNASFRDHAALEARVMRMVASGASRIPADHIKCIHGDANAEIGPLLAVIPREAYILVFADMEAPKQWPWESMRALRGAGHKSVDLYALLPLDMAIMRLISYESDGRERYAATLDRFFGTDAWRQLADRRITRGRSGELRRALTELYLQQLRTLWREAGPMVDAYLRGQQRLYKMLFATDHPVANRIAGWIRRHGSQGDQASLFG